MFGEGRKSENDSFNEAFNGNAEPVELPLLLPRRVTPKNSSDAAYGAAFRPGGNYRVARCTLGGTASSTREVRTCRKALAH